MKKITKKYVVWLVVALMIAQIANPGGNRASASGETPYVLVNEVGNGTFNTHNDTTKAKEVGIWGSNSQQGVNDIAIDEEGNLYFISFMYAQVYKVTPSGDLSTFAGIGEYATNPVTTDEQKNRVEGKRADEVRFYLSKALAIDSDNNMYIAEKNTGKVFKVDLDSNLIEDIYDIPMGGELPAEQRNVENIALDQSGNLYVYQSIGTDELTKTFYLGKLDVSQSNPTYTAITDIVFPTGDERYVHVAVDAHGDLYFSQTAQSKILKYSLSEQEPKLTTFLESTKSYIVGDKGDFRSPREVAFDASGNAYFTTATDVRNSSFGNQVYKVDSNGTMTRIAGNENMNYGNAPEGTLATVGEINGAFQIAINPTNGSVYFEDRYNYYIRSIQPLYTIDYVEGDDTVGTAPEVQQVFGNKSATIASPDDLTKTGHRFVKWNTAADGSGTDYAAGATLTPTANLTLHAIWEAEKYNLIYNVDANGNGTLTSGALVNQPEISHDNVPYNTLLDSVIAVPNSGYGFGGWSDGEEAASRQDTATASLSVTASFLKEYTVTFDTYGGTPLAPQIVLDGRLLILAEQPTNDDLTLEGWFSDAERTMQFDIATTVITSDLTLYASWEKKHTVSLYSNNGTAMSSISVTEATYMSPLADPVRTGHTFRGWYTDDETFTQAFNLASTPITGDISLYAKWDINSYTVTFVTYGGTAIDSQKVNYNELVVGPVTTAKEGHSFVGWYTDAGLNTPFDIANTEITGDIALHAKWDINPYTVTFVTYGGTGVSSQTVNYNELVVGPVTTTRDGHTFRGWYADTGFANAFDIENTPITGDISLHAKWEINNYIVTFVTYGGTAINSQQVIYNERVAGPVTTTKEGHSFVGWYTDAGLNTSFDIANTAITGDITLHAKWALTPPGAPDIVSTTAGNTTVEVVWNEVPFATGYKVYQGTTSGTTDTLVATVTDSVYRYEVTGLTNGMTYYFVVAAVNESGEEGSIEVSATPKAVASAPTGVTAVAGNGQATITFTAPAINGGSPITGYRVTSTPGNIVETTMNVDTTVVVTGLTNGTTYTFTVEALNAAGYGAVSEASAAVTPMTVPVAPTGVTAVAGNGQATITFTAPSNNGGSSITGYRVTSTPGNHVVTTTNDDTTVEVTGLTNGTSYTFTVEAMNEVGYGAASAASSAVTPKTVPVAPTEVTAVAGNGQATITFTAPSDNGGSAITGYRVTSTPDNIVATTMNDSTTVAVTGLTNGTSYTFTVEALNAAGYGAASTASDAVTPTAPPSGSGDNDDDTDTGSTDAGSTVEPVISTDGEITLPVGTAGEVQLGDTITVTIPAGASDQELKLTVEQVADIAGLADAGEEFASPVFELLKNFSDNFAVPVVLTFKFDPSKVQEGQRAAIFYYDENDKTWVEVGGTVSGDTITAEVDHFTKFAVLIVGEQAVEQAPAPYTDIAGHWAAGKIAEAVQQGIVSGYQDGTFKPDTQISRAEFAVMLAKALKLESEGAALGFIDAENIGAWAKASVAQAVEAGIISGYSDGSFRPRANITRAELAVMIARAYAIEAVSVGSSGFADESDIADWARGAVSLVKELGIVSGKRDNKYAPKDTATRAEAVTMIMNLLQVKK